ncbi:MAG: acyltransferase [Alkalinema sp. RU_4_3]|nr:acyltransferase [Alkalinema sp. RU_4_3]
MSQQSEKISNRIDWVDYAKGLGIVLVVMGHSLRGEMTSAKGSDLLIAHPIDAWIYAFHMPLFFFLSGLFARSLRNKTPQDFWTSRWTILIHPYLLWSLIIHGTRSIAGLTDQSWPEFIANFWRVSYEPIGIFWFLYVLGLISSLYYLLFSNVWIKTLNRSWVLIITTIASYTAYIVFKDAIAWEPLRRTLAFFPYFCLGSLCQELPNILSSLINSRSRRWQVIVAGFGAVTLGILANLWSPPSEPHLLLASCGILAIVALAQEMAAAQPWDLVKLLGVRSLQIYVLHTLFSSLAVKLLHKVIPGDIFWLDLAFGAVVGVFLSLAIAEVCQKMHWEGLFSLRQMAR